MRPSADPRPLLAALAAILAPSVAHAEALDVLTFNSSAPTLSDPPAPGGSAGAPADTGASEPPIAEAAARKVFAERHTWWWGFDAGAVFSDDANDYAGSVNFDYFLTDGFEFRFGFRGWYFDQDGDNAGGFNPHLGFRWHFLIEPESRQYTVYADLGIGLLFTSDDVPAGGTTFDFTPRAGIGVTWALGDSGARLDLGVGWHHISNASSFGTDDNPARDGIGVWAGVIFPF